MLRSGSGLIKGGEGIPWPRVCVAFSFIVFFFFLSFSFASFVLRPELAPRDSQEVKIPSDPTQQQKNRFFFMRNEKKAFFDVEVLFFGFKRVGNRTLAGVGRGPNTRLDVAGILPGHSNLTS